VRGGVAVGRARRIRSVAYFDWRDPAPFLVSFWRWAASFTRSVAKAAVRRSARRLRPMVSPASP
jgi:hypothetical protein